MVQFSATAYSPRLVLWLARSAVINHSIGVFTATFVYALGGRRVDQPRRVRPGPAHHRLVRRDPAPAPASRCSSCSSSGWACCR
ncbi:MAG: DUF2254 domain-containing protein [Ignavibacteriales bacterium]|nr:DUF2254 domain-containing protein [Ignavibacteriales bacterium]